MLSLAIPSPVGNEFTLLVSSPTVKEREAPVSSFSPALKASGCATFIAHPELDASPRLSLTATFPVVIGDV